MTAPQFAGQVSGQVAGQVASLSCERLESQPESRPESKKLTGARTFLSAIQPQGGLKNPPSRPPPANRYDEFMGGVLI